MNRRNNKRPLQKEKVCMIAASVFVLSALTLTGVYMASIGKSGEDDNRIDFAQIEKQAQEQQLADERFGNDQKLSQNDDMDVDPQYTEANSAGVTNDRKTAENLKNADRDEKTDARFGEAMAEEPSAVAKEEPVEETLISQEDTTEAAVEPSFGEGDMLQWPIVGEVLLDYSMDKAVYYATMQQYRYNPSIVIAATPGETITAAADGVVEKVYYDAQTGNSILFDLGDGYELTYGQLTDITLAQGDRVSAGDIVGKVAQPTIYYSVEGGNVYFKLTKDGQPINPLSRME